MTSKRIERRNNPRLREAYAPALSLLAIRLGDHGSAASHQRQHLAVEALGEAFPHLTPAEVDILALAILRQLAKRPH